jgi:uncharacterized protein (DUF2252 family)
LFKLLQENSADNLGFEVRKFGDESSEKSLCSPEMKVRKLVRSRDRAKILRDRRNLKMAGSAHAYVRGNTRKFYEWLEAADIKTLPQGPPIWICGDCHVHWQSGA